MDDIEYGLDEREYNDKTLNEISSEISEYSLFKKRKKKLVAI